MHSYLYAQAKFMVCECGAAYTLDRGDLQYEKKYKEVEYKPIVAIGSIVEHKGIKYRFTGFAVKKDAKYNFYWAEYTLFNPIVGYRFFSEYEGHWMFLAPTEKNFELQDQYQIEIKDDGLPFRLYSKYIAKPIVLAGEFHYDVSEESSMEVHEFINAPEIIIREVAKQSVQWLRGYYVEPGDIMAIFDADEVPLRNGIGVIQPQTFAMDFDTVLKISGLSLILFICIQCVFNINATNQRVLTFDAVVEDSTNAKAFVSPSFELKNGPKNLSYRLNSDVYNQWFETDVTLVNEKTGEDIDFEYGVEYYHGYTDGETWSEGNTKGDKLIEAVPSGKYHLLVTPIKDPTASIIRYNISLFSDVPTWWNLIKSMLLLAVIPLIQYFRGRNFEEKRWMDSDYSPFELENDE
jgi:hypothetical protein